MRVQGLINGGLVNEGHGLVNAGIIRVAAAGGVPTVSGNLIFDFDAASGVYKDAGTTLAGNGETVQQWNNATAYATPDPNLAQATEGSRPTYNTTGGPNNLPYIASNGKFLGMTGSTHASITWFFVMRHITWTFGNYVLCALNNHWDVRQKAASPNLRSETDGTTPADLTDFTLNTWMVLMIRNRTPSQSAWRAGSGTLQTQAQNGQLLGLAAVGAAAAGTLPSDISYARILGYDAGLDDTDTATIKGYLDGIYGTP